MSVTAACTSTTVIADATRAASRRLLWRAAFMIAPRSLESSGSQVDDRLGGGHRVARALDADDDAKERLLVGQIQGSRGPLEDGAGALVLHVAGLQRDRAVVPA